MTDTDKKRSPSKGTQDVPMGARADVVTFYFEDGAIKSVPYNPQKNLAQFLTTVLTARGLSVDNVTLKDQGTKQKVTWNVNSTFADLSTRAITVQLKEDKKAKKEKEKEKEREKEQLTASSSTQIPIVTVSSSDSTDTSDYSSSTSEKKFPRTRKTSSPKREGLRGRKRSHGRKQSKSEDEPEITTPLSESSSDSAVSDAITFYFGTGEFKKIPNDRQKSIQEVLENFARVRAFSLDTVKLVDRDSGKMLNWNSSSVFGDYKTVTFGIEELSEKELKKLDKKKGKKRIYRYPKFREHRNISISEKKRRN